MADNIQNYKFVGTIYVKQMKEYKIILSIRPRQKYIKICVRRGGAHLPIAHTLRLPEPTKKQKSEGGQRTRVKRRDTALRFGFFGSRWQAECMRYG